MKRQSRGCGLPGRQRGMALFLTIIVLVGATVISIAAARTSTMELRMAGNTESVLDTFQTALAAIDYVISDVSNLPTAGPLDVPQAVTLQGNVFDVSGSDSIAATATRVEDCAPPPRARNGSSLTAYSSFVYEISSTINRNQSGQGTGGVTQGYVLLGPKC